MDEAKGLRSMGDIVHIAHNSVREMFEDDVEVTEKVDGSFMAFGIINGELRMRSKGQQLFPGSPSSKMFEPGMDYVTSIADKLNEGWIYRGEYLLKPKHNSLAYSRIPANHIVIFDIEYNMGSHFGEHFRGVEARQIGLEAVPVLFRGK